MQSRSGRAYELRRRSRLVSIVFSSSGEPTPEMKNSQLASTPNMRLWCTADRPTSIDRWQRQVRVREEGPGQASKKPYTASLKTHYKDRWRHSQYNRTPTCLFGCLHTIIGCQSPSQHTGLQKLKQHILQPHPATHGFVGGKEWVLGSLPMLTPHLWVRTSPI